MRSVKALIKAGPVALLLLAGTAGANDSHCMDDVGSREPTTPDNEFVVLGGGIVEHEPTGLQWSQCALGQTPTAEGCEGAAEVFYWEEAQQAVDELNASGGLAGYNDWRLPTLKELLSIVERCRETPTINTDIFPNTPWTGFWTATLHKDDQDPHEAEHVDNPAYRGAHPEDEDEEDEYNENSQEKNPEAWFVGFYKGLEYPYDIYSSYRVRPVRAGN